ncbi:MAG: hypothetical protein LM514_02215 [Streptococcus sp.]|jgi:hypothetical protein|nr:hypothetical protein [Streptococcus sp.]
MDANTLFLKTLEDIESRLSQSDPYEILLIAGLLRKLFLDDHPLVDQVNRTYRVKLEFEVTASTNKPDEGDKNSLWSVQDGLDPETAMPGKKRLLLSRDQFFQTVVAMVFGPSFTVRDVIQFEANVAGAVHAGAPKTEKEKALDTVGKSVGIGGYAPTLRQLLAIARVSLKALVPLRAAINAA